MDFVATVPQAAPSSTLRVDPATSESPPVALDDRPPPAVKRSVAARAGKRAIDLIGAASGLLLLAPLMVVIAVIIRLDSPGPVLFRQRRRGRDGDPFDVLKFRTMVADAEQRLSLLEHRNESRGGVLFKMRQDPRVTRFGRVLRRTNLDELPQLINVLWGQMSLVGPRPLQIRDCNLLEQADPLGYARRLAVPQGMTGLWQVSDRGESCFERMLQLDLDYVERWSFGLDLRVIIKTFFVILAGRGTW